MQQVRGNKTDGNIWKNKKQKLVIWGCISGDNVYIVGGVRG